MDENHSGELEEQSSNQPLPDKPIRQKPRATAMWRGLNDQIAQLGRINLVPKVPRNYVALLNMDTSVLDKVLGAAQQVTLGLGSHGPLLSSFRQVAQQFQIATRGFGEVMKHITADLTVFDLISRTGLWRK